MRLNFEGLEIRKWNISTHSVQTDDGLYHRKAFYKVKILFYSSSKNGVIYLVNLFTSVIEMSNMAEFLCSLLMTAKK